MNRWQRSTTLLALLAAACGGERRPAGEAERTAEAEPEDMAMHAMQMPSMDMLPAVRAHLDSVVRAEPGELAGMVAEHQDRMERMLAAMHQDMNAMNMPGDAAWQALADSVRSDLAALRGLSGEQLVLRMRAHAGRMRRLLGRHEAMMNM